MPPAEQIAPHEESRATALGWIDADALRATHSTPALRRSAASPEPADLLARRPRRSSLRRATLIPVAFAALVVAAYCALTLMWPLTAVPPVLTAGHVSSAPAPLTSIAWPKAGSGALGVQGLPGTLTSTGQASSIASITKVVTALVVLDQLPLDVGQPGPAYRFTAADRNQYWKYLRSDESALDVPVGGTLTEYQMLEGMLIGSAGNYAQRLSDSLYPSNKVFASAANTWLQQNGISGITIVGPTGIEAGNTATPAALIALGERAMTNPVFAEIVAKPAVDLPGAGHVENTNGLINDPGVVGIKTGSLQADNLLAAKDLKIGTTDVRVYALTLDQPDDATRVSATRDLFEQAAKALQPRPSVTAGTAVGHVTTRWGEEVAAVTDDDLEVILWNGGAARVTTALTLGAHHHKGDAVGSVTAAGPLETETVTVRLARDIPSPSPWWRLTHPLDLLGVSG